MKHGLMFLGTLLVTSCLFAEKLSVFEMPFRAEKHEQLRQQMIRAMREGNTQQMEQICREGCKLLPEDQTWRYNLACALAYRENKDEAFEALNQAIELGFNDRKSIVEDNDLKQLHGDPRFQLMLKKADKLRNSPPKKQDGARPQIIFPGTDAMVSTSNTIWNFDLSAFQVLFDFQRPKSITPQSLASAYQGPLKEEMVKWLKEGTASANIGDFYENRDRGHSSLKVSDYPGMTRIIFSEEAKKYQADIALPNFYFPVPVLGNCSMSVTEGPYWRSLPRMIQSEPSKARTCSQLFLNNQLWFFPEHKDYDPQTGDLYPANLPCYVISQGSSYSDKPFMQAFAASMAAFQPKVKEYLVRTRRLAPTLQMLFRSTQRHVKTPHDYLRGKTHPAVFNQLDLDTERMIRKAHALTIEQVPPIPILRMVKEDHPQPYVDYFDLRTEPLFESPLCLARVMRGVARTRTYRMKVFALGVPKRQKISYTWRLLQGDPTKVEIKTVTKTGDEVEVTVAHHTPFIASARKTSRVDVACFIKTEKSEYSIPAILSVYSIPSEIRVYREDGQIQSVDYSNPSHLYLDPAISMQKDWKDFYEYSSKGQKIGWIRKRPSGTTQYTWAGHKVLSKDAKGRPLKARQVAYLPKTNGSADLPPILSEVDVQKTFTYRYANDEDQVGTFQ